jgi:hypothetical protein
VHLAAVEFEVYIHRGSLLELTGDVNL